MYQDYSKLEVDKRVVFINLLLLIFIMPNNAILISLFAILIICDSSFKINIVDIVYLLLTTFILSYARDINIEYIDLPIKYIILSTIFIILKSDEDKIPFLVILMPALSMIILSI